MAISIPRQTELLRIGNESMRDLIGSAPGDYSPRDYVHATRWTSLSGVECVTIVASYTPVGHGMASVASRQAMDAAARAVLPGARFSGSDRTTDTYGAFQLGARIRQYETTEDVPFTVLPAWMGAPVD